MTVPGWGDVAIDLSGLELSGTVPILSDHDSTRRGIVGHGRPEVKAGKLLLAGSISAGTAAVREFVEAARNGFPWQASVAAEVPERRQVPAGQAAAVNGRSLATPAGGMTLIVRGLLREVSIVGIGCDSATRVPIAASSTKTEHKRHERDKQRTERAGCGSRSPESGGTGEGRADPTKLRRPAGRIEAQAVADGWDLSRTELEVLRAQCPKPPAAHLPRRAAGSVETIEAAVLTRMGQAGLAERAMGTAAMEQAGRLGAT